MKIGIFIAYKPNAKLHTEGLGRYMALLIKGLLNAGCKIIIATPKWSIDSLKSLFEDCNVNTENIEYITNSKLPIALNMYYFFKKRFNFKKRKKRENRIEKIFKNAIEGVVSLILTTANIISFLLLLLSIAILALPIFIICLLFYPLKLIFKRLSKNKYKGINLLIKLKNRVVNKIDLRRLFDDKIYKMEITKILNLINNDKTVDVWYSPTMFWPEFNNINGVKVICAPDLVLLDFPTQFSLIDGAEKDVDKYSSTIKRGEFFITYSNFIKESLLIDKFGKKNEKVKVIPHGCNNLMEYVDVGSNIKYCDKDGKTNEVFSRLKIQEYANSNFRNILYLSDFSFSDVKYIFYASQNRPYKNIMNLIKAYEYLLRKKYIQVKLFLTCDFTHVKEVNDYIYANRLQYDVISFKNCSAQTLASLYYCAELVVNPTLYEGGFPFTFVEGMSVGVPSVMSRIPQVQETIEGYGVGDMLFDPYDYKDIAKKIMYGLNNREILIECETELYKAWSKRTWEVAAKEYKQAFEYFINEYNKNENDAEGK